MKKVILSMESYKDANGQEKTAFKRVGEIFTSQSGSEFLKLYMNPSIIYSIKEDKPREQEDKSNEVLPDNPPF